MFPLEPRYHFDPLGRQDRLHRRREVAPGPRPLQNGTFARGGGGVLSGWGHPQSPQRLPFLWALLW